MRRRPADSPPQVIERSKAAVGLRGRCGSNLSVRSRLRQWPLSALSGSASLRQGLPLTARERSFALRLSDGKLCPTVPFAGQLSIDLERRKEAFFFPRLRAKYASNSPRNHPDYQFRGRSTSARSSLRKGHRWGAHARQVYNANIEYSTPSRPTRLLLIITFNPGLNDQSESVTPSARNPV